MDWSIAKIYPRMGGGPRTYPGGVRKWQWKKMQEKKSKQILKAWLLRERQLYEMRKRAELKAVELERPWEMTRATQAATLFAVKPDAIYLCTDKEGPHSYSVAFVTRDGKSSARVFPRTPFTAHNPTLWLLLFLRLTVIMATVQILRLLAIFLSTNMMAAVQNPRPLVILLKPTMVVVQIPRLLIILLKATMTVVQILCLLAIFLLKRMMAAVQILGLLVILFLKTTMAAVQILRLLVILLLKTTTAAVQILRFHDILLFKTTTAAVKILRKLCSRSSIFLFASAMVKNMNAVRKHKISLKLS